MVRVALLGGIVCWPGEAVVGFVSWLSMDEDWELGRLSKTPKSDDDRLQASTISRLLHQMLLVNVHYTTNEATSLS
jgi:hypothetical protein